MYCLPLNFWQAVIGKNGISAISWIRRKGTWLEVFVSSLVSLVKAGPSLQSFSIKRAKSYRKSSICPFFGKCGKGIWQKNFCLLFWSVFKVGDCTYLIIHLITNLKSTTVRKLKKFPYSAPLSHFPQHSVNFQKYWRSTVCLHTPHAAQRSRLPFRKAYGNRVQLEYYG